MYFFGWYVIVYLIMAGNIQWKSFKFAQDTQERYEKEKIQDEGERGALVNICTQCRRWLCGYPYGGLFVNEYSNVPNIRFNIVVVNKCYMYFV